MSSPVLILTGSPGSGKTTLATKIAQASPRGLHLPSDIMKSQLIGFRIAIFCGLALGAFACLSATPPKTPNQREAERRAPHVVPPPPPDAGRTPRPATD